MVEIEKRVFENYYGKDGTTTYSDCVNVARIIKEYNNKSNSNTANVREKKLTKGCVIMMKGCSGITGYGNPQCISWVSEELGELSLYGHNQHYKTYDVDKVLEYPII